MTDMNIGALVGQALSTLGGALGAQTTGGPQAQQQFLSQMQAASQQQVQMDFAREMRSLEATQQIRGKLFDQAYDARRQEQQNAFLTQQQAAEMKARREELLYKTAASQQLAEYQAKAQYGLELSRQGFESRERTAAAQDALRAQAQAERATRERQTQAEAAALQQQVLAQEFQAGQSALKMAIDSGEKNLDRLMQIYINTQTLQSQASREQAARTASAELTKLGFLHDKQQATAAFNRAVAMEDRRQEFESTQTALRMAFEAGQNDLNRLAQIAVSAQTLQSEAARERAQRDFQLQLTQAGYAFEEKQAAEAFKNALELETRRAGLAEESRAADRAFEKEKYETEIAAAAAEKRLDRIAQLELQRLIQGGAVDLEKMRGQFSERLAELQIEASKEEASIAFNRAVELELVRQKGSEKLQANQLDAEAKARAEEAERRRVDAETAFGRQFFLQQAADEAETQRVQLRIDAEERREGRLDTQQVKATSASIRADMANNPVMARVYGGYIAKAGFGTANAPDIEGYVRAVGKDARTNLSQGYALYEDSNATAQRIYGANASSLSADDLLNIHGEPVVRLSAIQNKENDFSSRAAVIGEQLGTLVEQVDSGALTAAGAYKLMTSLASQYAQLNSEFSDFANTPENIPFYGEGSDSAKLHTKNESILASVANEVERVQAELVPTLLDNLSFDDVGSSVLFYPGQRDQFSRNVRRLSAKESTQRFNMNAELLRGLTPKQAKDLGVTDQRRRLMQFAERTQFINSRTGSGEGYSEDPYSLEAILYAMNDATTQADFENLNELVSVVASVPGERIGVRLGELATTEESISGSQSLLSGLAKTSGLSFLRDIDRAEVERLRQSYGELDGPNKTLADPDGIALRRFVNSGDFVEKFKRELVSPQNFRLRDIAEGSQPSEVLAAGIAAFNERNPGLLSRETVRELNQWAAAQTRSPFENGDFTTTGDLIDINFERANDTLRIAGGSAIKGATSSAATSNEVAGWQQSFDSHLRAIFTGGSVPGLGRSAEEDEQNRDRVRSVLLPEQGNWFLGDAVRMRLRDKLGYVDRPGSRLPTFSRPDDAGKDVVFADDIVYGLVESYRELFPQVEAHLASPYKRRFAAPAGESGMPIPVPDFGWSRNPAAGANLNANLPVRADVEPVMEQALIEAAGITPQLFSQSDTARYPQLETYLQVGRVIDMIRTADFEELTQRRFKAAEDASFFMGEAPYVPELSAADIEPQEAYAVMSRVQERLLAMSPMELADLVQGKRGITIDQFLGNQTVTGTRTGQSDAVLSEDPRMSARLFNEDRLVAIRDQLQEESVALLDASLDNMMSPFGAVIEVDGRLQILTDSMREMQLANYDQRIQELDAMARVAEPALAHTRDMRKDAASLAFDGITGRISNPELGFATAIDRVETLYGPAYGIVDEAMQKTGAAPTLISKFEEDFYQLPPKQAYQAFAKMVKDVSILREKAVGSQDPRPLELQARFDSIRDSDISDIEQELLFIDNMLTEANPSQVRAIKETINANFGNAESFESLDRKTQTLYVWALTSRLN